MSTRVYVDIGVHPNSARVKSAECMLFGLYSYESRALVTVRQSRSDALYCQFEIYFITHHIFIKNSIKEQEVCKRSLSLLYINFETHILIQRESTQFCTYEFCPRKLLRNKPKEIRRTGTIEIDPAPALRRWSLTPAHSSVPFSFSLSTAVISSLRPAFQAGTPLDFKQPTGSLVLGSNMAARSTSIIIVGAGISGLQAANTFLAHPASKSLDITILEGSERIGGRVHTKSDWGFPLDYGALPVAYSLID